MHERLKLALDALGYDSVKELNYKSNLVHAIQVFALMKGDDEMEEACDAEIENIRMEVAKRQSSGK
jgi:hypothetical protein